MVGCTCPPSARTVHGRGTDICPPYDGGRGSRGLRRMKKIGLATLLVMGSFAGIVLSGSPASAESTSCVDHTQTLGATIVHQGEQVLIDETVERCGAGLGLRVHVRQEIWGPTQEWTLGPVTTFVGYRDVVTFF